MSPRSHAEVRRLLPGALAFVVLVLAASLPRTARALTPEWVEAWRADLAFAADSLPRAHPDFFHQMSREDWRAELDALSTKLSSLEQHEVVVELARIVVGVGEGHTRVTFPFDRGAGFFTGHATTADPKVPGLVFRHVPVRFGMFGDSLWVTRSDAAHRALLGGRVVRLGRMTAAEAMRAVEPVVQRDNPSQVRHLLPSWLVCPEILAARGVIADRERFEIEVEPAGGGRRHTAALTPVAPGALVEWLEARPVEGRPRVDQQPERAHWFEVMPDRRAVYARIREVQNQPGHTFANFADSLIAAFAASGARRLVLDLRGNPGGDGTLKRGLIRHLIASPALAAPGALWALIDRGTFSAAVMLAADLETWTPAILVGEPTGGNPNSFGDSRRIVLPKSGITVRVSNLYWQITDPRDDRGAITPHLAIDPTFDDWRNNRDPVLEATLSGGEASMTGAWTGVIGFESGRDPIAFSIARPGSADTSTVTSQAFGFDRVPLVVAGASTDTLRASWNARGETWRLAAVRAGGHPRRLVGSIQVLGRLLPVVLRDVESVVSGTGGSLE